MNRTILYSRAMTSTLLGFVLSACLVTNAVAGPKGKTKAATAEDLVLQEQELLLNECKPGDDQRKSLNDKFAAKREALATWEKANAEKIKAAESASEAARKGSDANAKKSATGMRKELEESRALATAEADRAIQGVLSEEQRATWAGAQLAQSTLRRYQRANLTEEQTAKIKSACVIAARDLATHEGDDKKSKQGRSTIQKSLQWAIDNVILTVDQRTSRSAGARNGKK